MTSNTKPAIRKPRTRKRLPEDLDVISGESGHAQGKGHRELSLRVRMTLIVSLVIISIFPVFVTFAPQEWPLQPSVLVIDAIYLIILAGYLLVLTGKNHSRWFIATLTAIGIIGVVAMVWLTLTLATIEIRW